MDEILNPLTLAEPPPLYRTEEIRLVDKRAAAEGLALMERAGGAAAHLIFRLTPSRGPVLFLAGPGNNGGDAWATARRLHIAGCPTTVVCRADQLPMDAAAARRAYLAAGGATETEFAPLPWALAVDGLFGAGLVRPVRGDDALLIERFNALPCRRLALDVPSGLSCDSGRVLGAAVKADHTLAFIGLKPGYYSADGPEHCGTIHLAPLGLTQQNWVRAQGRLITGTSPLPPRARDSHKGLYGRIGVVGGAPGWVGAALLAGRAALAAGGGLVTLGILDDRVVVDYFQPELMLRNAEELVTANDLDVLAVGPGLGQSGMAKSLLKTALTCACALVLDADALNLLASHPALAEMVAERAAPTVITPHPGEAARLLGVSTQQLREDRLGNALRLAKRLRSWTVLKGLGTIIAGADGNFHINASGHPALAAPGMGDVLTGLVAAYLARLPAEAATCGAVWLHGKAGEDGAARIGGAEGLRASEVVELVRSRVNRGSDDGRDRKDNAMPEK